MAVRRSRSSGPVAPSWTGTSAPHSSTVYRALRLAWGRGTLPATTVIATTSTAGSRRAMMRATASSEAVSVSTIIGVGKDGSARAGD